MNKDEILDILANILSLFAFNKYQIKIEFVGGNSNIEYRKDDNRNKNSK